jgi:hypothetical protein
MDWLRHLFEYPADPLLLSGSKKAPIRPSSGGTSGVEFAQNP